MIALVDFFGQKNIAILFLKAFFFALIFLSILSNISTGKSVEIDISPVTQTCSLNEKSTIIINLKFSDDISRISTGKIVISLPSPYCILNEISYDNIKFERLSPSDDFPGCYEIFFSINSISPNLKYDIKIPFSAADVRQLNILIKEAYFKDQNENKIEENYKRNNAVINYQVDCDDKKCEDKNGEIIRYYADTNFGYNTINTNCTCGQDGCVCKEKDIIIDVLNLDQCITIEPSNAHLYEPVNFSANLTGFRNVFDKYPEISIEYNDINNNTVKSRWNDRYNAGCTLNNLSIGQQDIKISCLFNSSFNGNCSKSISRNVEIYKLDGLDVYASILSEEAYVGDNVSIQFICTNYNDYPVSNITINMTLGSLFSPQNASANIDRIEPSTYKKEIIKPIAINEGYYMPTDVYCIYNYFGKLISQEESIASQKGITISKKPSWILPYLWFIFSFFVGIIAGLTANYISSKKYFKWILLFLIIITIIILLIIGIISWL